MAELKKVPWPGWEIVGLLGRGSFGAVYEIRRKLINGESESAALKVISIPQNADDIDEMYSEGYDEESITATFDAHLKSITTEYSLMGKLQGCANVVNCKDIYHIQHDDGIGWDIFIRMELLTPMLKAHPPEETVTEQTVIKLGRDICNALVLCKEYGIVHRDIKPQNIFVSKHGDYKLGDFGIAKTVERTLGGTRIGTYKYMAPEVYNNQPYGSAADIYSLGLVLYWLLNERRLPFLPLPPARVLVGQDEKARIRRMTGETVPAPKHGSDALKQIVLKACAYDQKDRYESAAQMLADLNKLTSGFGREDEKTVDLYDVSDDDEKTVGPEYGIAHDCRKAGTDFDTDDDKTMSAVDGEDDEKTVGPEYGAAHGSQKTDTDFNTDNDKTMSAVDGEDDEKTVGPEYGAAHGSQKTDTGFNADNGKITSSIDGDDDEKTVGPQYDIGDTHRKKSQPKNNNLKYILIAAGVVVAVVLFLLLRSCGTEEPDYYQPDFPMDGEYSDTEPTDEQEPTDEATVPDTGNDTPDQLEWSDWVEKLPDNVSADKYDIEEKTVYSSRVIETTSSTQSDKMDGWELFDKVEANGGFGPWSNWSDSKVTASATRKVETQKRYRYRDKETSTGTSKSKSGWTLDESKKPTESWGNYGAWSSWSTTKVSNSDSRKVETKTQYRQRSVSGSNSFTSWSAWQNTEVTASSTREVEKKVYYPYYYYYCTKCGDGAKSPFCGNDVRCERCRRTGTVTSETKVVKWFESPWDASKDWGDGKKYQYFDQVMYWNDTLLKPKTQYRYRDRIAQYGEWSSWSDTAVSENANRQIETRTVYRYCDRSKVVTYHFYRWGKWTAWSANKATASGTRQVEETTYYRYCDQVSATTYYFRRWSAWSEYSEQAVTPVENQVDVKIKTQYRYRSKVN